MGMASHDDQRFGLASRDIIRVFPRSSGGTLRSPKMRFARFEVHKEKSHDSGLYRDSCSLAPASFIFSLIMYLGGSFAPDIVGA